MEKLQVAIADDNERIVELLGTMIRSENGMEIVGTAGNGEDAVDMIRKSQPDVVLLDLIRAVDKPPNFVNVTRYHDKNLAKIAEIFQRKRSWFSMPWPLSSF